MDGLVRLALASGQPLSDLMTWEPEWIATAWRVLDEQAAKQKG